jgi:hypothetical protein
MILPDDANPRRMEFSERTAATWGWLSEKSERLVVVILGVSYRSKKTQDLTRCPKLFRVEQRIDERPPGEERANEG